MLRPEIGNKGYFVCIPLSGREPDHLCGSHVIVTSITEKAIYPIRVKIISGKFKNTSIILCWEEFSLEEETALLHVLSGHKVCLNYK